MKLFLKLIAFGCLSLVCFVLICIVILRFVFSEWYIWKPIKLSLNGVRCLEADDPKDFYESSGFTMPTNAKIILSCDDHSSFHWDGEYYIVFDTTSRYINRYLSTKSWSTSWKRGPIPDEIASNTGLSKEFPGIFKSPAVWYLVESTSPSTIKDSFPFYNGRLIVIDSKNNRVFYSQWDF